MTQPDARALFVISVAAELAGVHPQTLRIYERKGLVQPARTQGRSRRYSERDIARLRRIQELTNEGLSLQGVERVLDLEARLGHALDRHAPAGFEDPLPVQRVHLDLLAAQQRRKGALWLQRHLMAIGEDDFGIGMDLAVGEPRHAMVHAARDLADLRMQRAAERHVHFLKASTNGQQRNARFNNAWNQWQRGGVAMRVM